MKSRTERKPPDPKMLVHVPHAAAGSALPILRQTFGPNAPAPVEMVIRALAFALENHDRVRSRKPTSRFAALLKHPELTIPAMSPGDLRRIKATAHGWARYHGCRVATRTHPAGTAVTVYLLQVPA